MSMLVDPDRALEAGASAKDAVRLWLHLLNKAIPDSLVRRWVLCWLGWKIQNPGLVPGTILILIGSKGTGKNSIIEPIVRIFGAHGLVCDDPEQVAGRFTVHLMDKCFVVLDEALFSGDPRQADRIKARVTATVCSYEAKGLTPIPGYNRAAFALLTNHEHAWQATWDERRAAVVNVSDELRGDMEFWSAYHAAFTNEGLGQLLGFLQSIDLTGFNPRVVPQSAALRRQQALTALRDLVLAWWADTLDLGAVQSQFTNKAIPDAAAVEIEARNLRESWDEYRRGRAGAVAWNVAARKLKDLGLPEMQRRGAERKPVYVLPGLTDLRSAFTAATGYEFSPSTNTPAIAPATPDSAEALQEFKEEHGETAA